MRIVWILLLVAWFLVISLYVFTFWAIDQSRQRQRLRRSVVEASSVLLLTVLLASCDIMPPKALYISMPDCAGRGQVQYVRMIDTSSPLLSCIKAAPPADAGMFVLMTVLGAPPAACSIIWRQASGGIHHAEIYAALTPPVAVGLAWAAGFRTPEQAIAHELEHIRGNVHTLLPFVDCCEGKHDPAHRR